jgi:hypothetical protein
MVGIRGGEKRTGGEEEVGEKNVRRIKKLIFNFLHN